MGAQEIYGRHEIMDEPGRFNLVSNIILFFILIGVLAICAVIVHPVITNNGFVPSEKPETVSHSVTLPEKR